MIPNRGCGRICRTLFAEVACADGNFLAKTGWPKGLFGNGWLSGTFRIGKAGRAAENGLTASPELPGFNLP